MEDPGAGARKLLSEQIGADNDNLSRSCATSTRREASYCRDAVLSQAEHIITIGNQQIKLKVYNPSPSQKACGNQEPTAEKFLEDSRTHEKFKQYNLSARALERSTCVRVENLPPEANNNKTLLELYFEKWGGPVNEVITIPSEQAAIITFKDEEAKEKVLKQENNICDVLVKTYPYIKSLDIVLYGGVRPHLKLPEPITVSVHPAIREFILKKGKISSITDRMIFCQISMDKPEILLSPDPALLKHNGVTRNHINSWSKNATDAFKKIISNYTTSEWPVSHALWSKVERDVKEIVKDQVFTHMDASKGVLTLAGMNQDISGLKPIIKETLENATKQMEREKKSVKEYLEMSPAIYSLLEQDGLKSVVSPNLHIVYDIKMNRLILSGLHTESLAFKVWFFEKKVNMKQKHLQIDHSVLEFLRSVDCGEMSRDLFISHGITAVYTIESGDVVVIGSTEKALADAEKRVKTVLTTKGLTLEDQGVVHKTEWLNLHKHLENSFKTSVFINLSKQRDKVIVTGFREPVMEVSECLGDFIEKHTRIKTTVCVKSHAVAEYIKERKSKDWQHFTKSDEVKVSFDSLRPWIKLSGERTFVQPAITFFKILADALYTDKTTIKKAGAKKYFMEQGKIMLSMLLKEKRFVVVVQEDDMLEEEEDEFTPVSFEDIGQVSCEVRMPGGVTVTVRKADICKLQVDAVVNAANEDLKHIGGLALALLQAAGPCLQQDCDQYTKVNGRLKPGDAIITNAGRLPCKYVLHAVGPRFRDSDRHTTVQRLRHAIRESLNQALSKNCSSIAIPVISSGIFGCPLDLCTESIAKEVHEYIEYHNHRGSSSTLNKIHLVDNNSSTVNAMTQAVRKEFAVYNPKTTFSNQTKPLGHNDYGHTNRGNGHGCGIYGQRNQEFEGSKGSGNKDFEGQAHWRRENLNYGGRSAKSEGVLVTKTTQGGLQIILGKGNIQDASADIIVNTISEDLDLNKVLIGNVFSPSRGVHTMQLGQVTLEVSSGDITKEKTDAIVNSSNQTFSLKAGVSKAILDAAGVQVEQECSQIVARSSNVHQTEIVTSSGRLPCRNIIHITGHNSPSKIKDIVLSVLKLCESRQITSVAFPALGTGQGGAKPSDAADAMVNAVVNTVKKKKPVHVKLVKFVIFQTNMLADFHQSMMRRSDFFGGKSSESSTNEEFVMVGEEIEPVVFQLCGETPKDLSEARDMINSLLEREHVTIPIRDPAIAHFTREDVEMLNAMQRELTVSVRLERKGQDSVITLEGLTRDAHAAESRIRDMIRKVDRNDIRRIEAFIINSAVQWQYQENGQSVKNFDMLNNYELEQAYQKSLHTVRIKINNDEYEANLVRKEATRGRMKIKLNRVDLQAEAGAQNPLPSHWEDMKGRSVVVVKLTAGSKEYADVEKEFRRTNLTNNIIQIERIQNNALWKNYMIKKEELEDKNKHKNNEKLLFHGTRPDKTNQINHHGFNRSFAGMNGAMYGNGSYFAVNPHYSAQGYSTPDTNGHKCMYLVRVLVGDFTQGNAGLLVPPAKSSNSADLYNSVTDNMNNPTIDGVLSQAEHSLNIDNQEIKLKVYKPSTGQKTEQACENEEPKRDGKLTQDKNDINTDSQQSKLCKTSDVGKQADSTGQRTEEVCGYQEPNQSVLQTQLDVKKPRESSAVVLENFPDDFNQEILTLLVENISSLSESDFSMELIPELGKAVVTFKNPNMAGKFIEDSRTHEKSKKNNLRARALERSTCVWVGDLPAKANNNKMLLELYFEKWGGPVEDVITIPSEQAAIITFKEEEAVEKVLKQENNICDVPVKIYPYYKSLNTVLNGGSRPHLKLPEPITVSVHPAIREFILKKGQISSIEDRMSFCQVNMDKPDVLLSPDPALLKQKGVSRRHIDGWSKNAIDAFKKMISNYTTSEWPVSHALWCNLESDIKKVVKDKVFTYMDASKGVLTLAGMTHEIIGLKPIMEKILDRATNQMEREKNSVTDGMEISPVMYSLLEQDGLKSAAPPDLHIDYNKKMSRLIFSGLRTETLTFKNWVLEKKISMKQKSLQNDRSVLEFLKSVDCDETSKDLFISHGITAVYTIENGDIVVIGSTERALNEAEKKINTVITTKLLILEDQGILQMPEWLDLKKQLENSFNTSKKTSVCINLSQRDKVTVTGFREPVTEVSKNLGCFIEEHTRIETTVRVKSHAAVEFIKDRKLKDWQHFMKHDKIKVNFDPKRPRIKLSGERIFVQPALTFFQRLADALHTDTMTIKKAGAKKYFKEQGEMMLSMLLKEKRFVVVLQEDYMLEEEEEEENVFTEGSLEDFGQVSCEVQMPGGVTVTVRKADICKIRVHAVVNAANEDLKHIGGVALALLQAAGPSLQQHCDLHTEINGRLKPGDAIITDAGRLPCKYVVHAVGPRFSDSDRRTTVQRLRRAVRESLNQASSKNCSSIAIPVISSGVFGCPLDLCTESIAKEVHEYIEDLNRRHFRSTLTEIYLVDSNGNTVNAMTQAIKKEFADYNPKITFPHQAKPHGYSNNEQGYRGNGSGRSRGGSHVNYGKINEEYKGAKGHGNKDFEGQAHWRKETSNYGGRSDISEGLSVLETKTTPEGVRIILSKGNIQDASADIIVNTISEDLDLSKGAVSNALLQTAGHQLQTEITGAAHSNNLNYGEMVITDGYKLKCQKVFHVVCPVWKQSSEDKVLSQIIRNCLKNAEKWRMASVVFPAIGTGNLGFPRDLVARIMLTEVQEFNPTNLREITVIVHPSDKKSVECFSSVFRHGIQGPITKGAHRHVTPKKNISGKSSQTSELVGKVSSPSLGVHMMQLGQVTLKVSSGDITKEKIDAIVNSSNHTFSLKAGVSKAILDAAGVKVEQECSQIGQGGANPADVADAMVDAVVEFVKKKKPVHVKFVKFLIFQTAMVEDFHQSMVRRSGEKVEEDKSLFTKIKDFFWGEGSESHTNEEFVMVDEEVEPAVFQLCGETPKDLSEAKEMISSLILREHVTIKIRDPAITHFTRKDGETLNAMQRELTVSVRLEKKGQDSVITLEGLTRDVHTAESCIRDMIRKVERNETRRSEAFFISSVVQWQYQENGRSIKNFDMSTNYDLEQAFRKRQPSVRIMINNDEYEADLVRKEATRRGISIELNRVDLQAAATTKNPLPSHWEDMKGQSVVLVKLTAGSKEYADVEKEFRRTNLINNIIEIERVQNSALWKNYMIKKEELEEKNKHKNNEKLLFHGTGPNKTDQINNHGFNRSFAGMHGAMYGNGSYFAVDPSYSAQGYSKPDTKGHKRMYLVRVLVGDFTQGKPGLPVPPAKSSNSADLYNSVTDNMTKPTMFVIFNDVQAYPEYLITFQ
ncbi:poly [ADP-ribose] polymerase 14-like protein [Labeo rohita]|uniref:Poly [ADP-ribose] polymerase n=1 Tax=Labeo rohita TaxID=84645 RepID=A0A498N5M5_LABRO|nr:poly [ADP-ribose] polymerase 14-like protein [Labeo rohita]